MEQCAAEPAPEYSDWQVKRLRTRLLAYLLCERLKFEREAERMEQRDIPDQFARNERKPNWYSVADQICTCEAVEHLIPDLDENDEDPPERANVQTGMPVNENMLWKFVEGENKRDTSGNKYRHFIKPNNESLHIVEDFLKYNGFLTAMDLRDHDGNFPAADALLSYLHFGDGAPRLPQDDPFNGDFVHELESGSNLVRRLLTIHLDKGRKYHRVREARFLYDSSAWPGGVAFRQRVDQGRFDRRIVFSGWAVTSPEGLMVCFAQDEDELGETNLSYLLHDAATNAEGRLANLTFAESRQTMMLPWRKNRDSPEKQNIAVDSQTITFKANYN